MIFSSTIFRLLWLAGCSSLFILKAYSRQDEPGSSASGHEIKAPYATSSNLPVLVIETDGKNIVDYQRIQAHLGIINHPGERNDFNGEFNEYDGIISIEQRGSSSAWVSDKKSYSFETQNDTNGNLNVSLLGLPPENDWILVGEYSDKTLIRNFLAYELSRRMGWYASRVRFCEFFLNGDYRGIYMLAEKIKRDNNRLNLATLNPDEIQGDDLTGGYIIRIDRPDECWISPYKSPTGNMNVPISYYYPKGTEMPKVQKDYIKNYVTQFEHALHGESFQDPAEGYLPYVNVSSFTDFFIISELSKNIDAYRLSTFMHKDRDSRGGKLTMGPVWDVNLGFGNANYYSGSEPEGWVIHSIEAHDDFQIPFWWIRLREDPQYNAVLKNRWSYFRKTVLDYDYIDNLVDSIYYVLDEAQERNFERWPILGEWVWPNVYFGGTYDNEISYLLSWTYDRLRWMDEQIYSIVGIPEDEIIANDYEIYPYPNPFISSLFFRMFLFDEARVTVLLYDATGREVAALDSEYGPGVQEITLYDQGVQGNIILSGIYLYQIKINGKMVRSGKVIRQ